MSDNRLVRNAYLTPDGTIIRSRSRHDFMKHKDVVTGNEYFVDGGTCYSKFSDPDNKLISLCLYEEDLLTHEARRNILEWGTYGKNGDEPLKFIKIKDMETSHIEVILMDDRIKVSPFYQKTMEDELKERGNGSK